MPHKRAHQQAQQDTTEIAARPGVAVEHAVIILELRLVTQAHDPQRRRHGALSGCQNGTDEQDFGPFPHLFAEDQFKVPQDGYNGRWQVTHGSVLSGNWI